MKTNSLVNAVVSELVDVPEVSDFLFVKEVVGLVRGSVLGGKVSGKVAEVVGLVWAFVVGKTPISTVKLISVMQETSPLSLALTVRR